MNFNQKFSILFLLVFIFCVEPIFPQYNFEFKGSRKREQINFTKAGGLIVIKTYINDKGPFNFILDSGVGLVIITDPDLKDSLKLKILRRITVAGLGELDSINAFLAPFLKLSIGSTVAKSLGAAILEKDIFNLSGLAGIKIHGLIGYDFFSNFIIKTHYEAGFLTLSHKNYPRPLKKGYKIPITIEENKPYCNANITINKKDYQLKFLIDNGAGHALALESLNENEFPLPPKYIEANLGIGLGGKINGFVGRTDQLVLGNFKLENIITSFPAHSDVAAKIKIIPRNGSIGNRLLRYYNVTYDYKRGFIYLRPISKAKPIFEHNMSGLEIISGGENYNRFFINDIEKGSPADELGLKKNDELIALNFKKTSEMSLEEINELLKSKPNKTIFVEAHRNDEFILGVLTLKRRI